MLSAHKSVSPGTLPAIHAFALSLHAMAVNCALVALNANQGRALLSNTITVSRVLAFAALMALLLGSALG